jgi:hypothetical protein
MLIRRNITSANDSRRARHSRVPYFVVTLQQHGLTVFFASVQYSSPLFFVQQHFETVLFVSEQV